MYLELPISDHGMAALTAKVGVVFKNFARTKRSLTSETPLYQILDLPLILSVLFSTDPRMPLLLYELEASSYLHSTTCMLTNYQVDMNSSR